MFLQVGAPIFAGVGFLFVALVLWVQGQRRHSLALQWLSLGQVAFALCAGLGAVYQLFHPRTSDLWSDLVIAALFLAVCASLVGLVYGIREAQRGSGLQR
jgi:protein-S-isoprenylcysteine O-methyltransferase Ste14